VATETEAQRKVLAELGEETISLDTQQETLDATRRRVWDLMVQAKNLKVSSYKIAEVAKLSQPRVMQIIKEQDEGPPRKAPRAPTQKSLLKQVSDLQEELAQVKAQQTEGNANDNTDSEGEPSPAEG
jgi:hypothetical protein